MTTHALLCAAFVTAIPFASVAAQATRATPVLLSEAEAKAVFSRHRTATQAPAKKNKYKHYVMEMTVAQGLATRIETFTMVPDKTLVITTVLGYGTTKSAFDGEIGWSQAPRVGVKRLEGEPLKALRANFGKPHAPAMPDSARIYSVGQEVLNGRTVNGFLTALASGDSSIMYVDAETGLMAGMRNLRLKGEPADTSTVMLFSDYRSVDGTMLPMTTTIRVRESRCGSCSAAP